MHWYLIGLILCHTILKRQTLRLWSYSVALISQSVRCACMRRALIASSASIIVLDFVCVETQNGNHYSASPDGNCWLRIIAGLLETTSCRKYSLCTVQTTGARTETKAGEWLAAVLLYRCRAGLGRQDIMICG